jgi:protein dithiol:quinone oxidoreductase
MIIPSNRQTHLLIVTSIAGLMGYGLYTQYVGGLEPCPLCMTQRFFYCLIGFLAFIAAVHNKARIGYATMITLSAVGGTAAAGRQVWLQHLPPEQVPACGPSLQYMLETFPLGETLKALVTGDGNCAEVVWSFLGLSMGEWSLLWFLAFIVIGLWQAIRRS